MTSLDQLETCVSELAAAVKSLATHCRNVEAPLNISLRKAPQPLVVPEAPSEAHEARRSIMASAAKLQILLADAEDSLQSLAKQNQLLACLQWLGEFQVLACIPLNGSVAIKDVADLADIPEAHFCRVVRMTATTGFLCEPQPGYVAHSALSAQFVTRPSLLDAAMFLSQTAAPASLQMAVATRRFKQSQEPGASAYNIAFDTSVPFLNTCEQRMQRRWSAYLRHIKSDVEAGIAVVLTRLNWLSLGSASVVEVGAQSTAMALALAEQCPALVFIVQMSEPGSYLGTTNGNTPGQTVLNEIPASPLVSRITIQHRASVMPQTIYGAAVYILRIPSFSPGVPSHSVPALINAELRAHVDVLRSNDSSRLIIISGLLPDPGTTDPDIEAIARLRDLSLLQLANGRELEIKEFMDILNNVKDDMGGLILANKLWLPSNAMVILEIKYKAYGVCYENCLDSIIIY